MNISQSVLFDLHFLGVVAWSLSYLSTCTIILVKHISQLFSYMWYVCYVYLGQTINNAIFINFVKKIENNLTAFNSFQSFLLQQYVMIANAITDIFY